MRLKIATRKELDRAPFTPRTHERVLHGAIQLVLQELALCFIHSLSLFLAHALHISGHL
jgi:hypothetical protein